MNSFVPGSPFRRKEISSGLEAVALDRFREFL
jgi:hypothetical protein